MKNFERMIQLADETFATRNDPNQLDVNQEIIEHLIKLHPACVSEKTNEDGPICWILLIPTTEELMTKFLRGEINEKELYEQTPKGIKYDSIYLCSAMVLKEFRRKGIAKELTLKAIEAIKKDHPIKTLFVWNFTEEGNISSRNIAKLSSLPLLVK